MGKYYKQSEHSNVSGLPEIGSRPSVGAEYFGKLYAPKKGVSKAGKIRSGKKVFSSVPQSRMWYRLRKNDTLSVVAKKVYGNPRFYTKITNHSSNKERIKNVSSLPVGFEVYIP